MENITIGQIGAILAYISVLGGSVAYVSKIVTKAVEKALKPLNDKIDKVDKNATMNYLVARLDEIEKGEKLEGVAKKRFIDELEHYTNDLKGNSYIHEEVERLKKEGKM